MWGRTGILRWIQAPLLSHYGARSFSPKRRRELLGLRPPQLGALHAILANRSTENTDASTVVMPTGTGKTATMLTAYCHSPMATLVMVPSDTLRTQIASSFATLGKLPQVGAGGFHCPAVLVLKSHRQSSTLWLQDGHRKVSKLTCHKDRTESGTLPQSLHGALLSSPHHRARRPDVARPRAARAKTSNRGPSPSVSRTELRRRHSAPLPQMRPHSVDRNVSELDSRGGETIGEQCL